MLFLPLCNNQCPPGERSLFAQGLAYGKKPSVHSEWIHLNQCYFANDIWSIGHYIAMFCNILFPKKKKRHKEEGGS